MKYIKIPVKSAKIILEDEDVYISPSLKKFKVPTTKDIKSYLQKYGKKQSDKIFKVKKTEDALDFLANVKSYQHEYGIIYKNGRKIGEKYFFDDSDIGDYLDRIEEHKTYILYVLV